MFFVKSRTIISSYPSSSVSYSLDIKKQTRCWSLLSDLKKSLRNNDETKNLKFTSDTDVLSSYILIQGIVIWDNIPVTDLRIRFNKENDVVVQIEATHFTFRGNNEGFLDCESIERQKDYCETLIEKESEGKYSCAHTAFHYINASKVFVKNKDNTTILLRIYLPYLKYYDKCKNSLKHEKKIGIPLIVKSGTTDYIIELNCKNADKKLMSILTQVDKKTWELKRPSFLIFDSGYPDFVCCVEKVIFTAHKKSFFGKLPTEWKEIEIKLIQEHTPRIRGTDVLQCVLNAHDFVRTHDYNVSDDTILLWSLFNL